MSVEREYVAMRLKGTAITVGLIDEPLEKRHHCPVAYHDEALWMPLHAKDALSLSALNSLDDAIRAASDDSQMLTRLFQSLMMERIYSETLTKKAAQNRTFIEADIVGCNMARCILGMFQKIARMGIACVEILIDGASEGTRKRLNTTADAQHGNLAVEGQLRQ